MGVGSRSHSVIIIPTPQREGLMKKLITANLICLLLVLAACSSIKHQPSQTAIPATAIPSLALTQVPLLATETPHPEGQPASQWKGIPIMPGAIAGEGDEESYV